MRKLSNKSGIVMVMVLLVVSVLMILSVSILSSTFNKNIGSQGGINDVKCEQLVKGYFWKDLSAGTIGVGTYTVPDPDHPTTKNFTIIVSGTNPYEYKCQY